MKKCKCCDKTKSLLEFSKASNKKDGLNCYCKSCTNKRSAEWYTKNPEKKRQYHNNRPNRTEYNKNHNLKQNYGITSKQYDELAKKQEYKCAICKNPETTIDKRTGLTLALSIDHCHMTGKIRKLLCGSCNTGLGKFKENIQLLKCAVDYLEVSRCA